LEIVLECTWRRELVGDSAQVHLEMDALGNGTRVYLEMVLGCTWRWCLSALVDGIWVEMVNLSWLGTSGDGRDGLTGS